MMSNGWMQRTAKYTASYRSLRLGSQSSPLPGNPSPSQNILRTGINATDAPGAIELQRRNECGAMSSRARARSRREGTMRVMAAAVTAVALAAAAMPAATAARADDAEVEQIVRQH